MAGAVGPGDARPVETEDHRQAVQRHVVHDLVPRSGQERRVEGDDGTKTAERHPCGTRDGVLFGDADVEETVGETGLERQQTGGAGHRRSDRHDPLVGLGDLDDRLGERLGASRWHCHRRPDDGVEHRGVVEVLLVVVFGRRVPAALLGEHMDDDRALGRQLDGVGQRGLELLDVVPVHRPDVAHTEGLEEPRRLEELTHSGLEAVHRPLGLLTDDGDLAQELLDPPLAAHVHRVEPNAGEPVRQPLGDAIGEAVMALTGFLVVPAQQARRQVRHRRCVGAAIVVEDHDHAPVAVTEIVQRLVRHAARHRPVADHGDDVAVIVAARIASDGETEGVAQDRRGMAVLDEVVLALLARRVAGQPAALAQLLEAVLPPRDDLVHIRLVPGVPEDGIGGRFEDAVQGEGELDCAEVGTEVAAVLCNGGDDEVADLASQLVELGVAQVAEVLRAA